MGLEERTKLRKLLLENMGKSREAGAPRDNGVFQRRSLSESMEIN
jgi:hypothetical protein